MAIEICEDVVAMMCIQGQLDHHHHSELSEERSADAPGNWQLSHQVSGEWDQTGSHEENTEILDFGAIVSNVHDKSDRSHYHGGHWKRYK